MEDPARLGEILEPVRAEIAQCDVARQLPVHELCGRIRHEQLTPVRARRDARGFVQRQADVVVPDRIRVTGVHTHPDAQRRR